MPSSQKPKGLIINNIGSPSGLNLKAVQKYLSQFLMDPAVIDLPFLWRFILVKLLIVPFRAPQSLKKYESIWDNGSPLLNIAAEFCQKLQEGLGADWRIEIGMRYGQPSIENALQNLRKQNCQEIYLLPLYPQWAEATIGSAEKELLRLSLSANNSRNYLPKSSDASGLKNDLPEIKPNLKMIPYDRWAHEDSFYEMYAQWIVQHLPSDCDDLFLSFHGLPLKALQKRYPQHCLSAQCCDSYSSSNEQCYRAQCFEFMRRLKKLLKKTHPEIKLKICFQSRLKGQKWLQPFSDEEVSYWAQNNPGKNLAIASPAFSWDCLETLEEIQIGLKKDFEKFTSGNFYYIPCLNSEDFFIEFLTERIRKLSYSIPEN